ncbi:LysR family transcriptional regulator [Cellulomonas sp. ICMP 17802]|uniref:LysR family transcriptional regulator n=1 Tax=Cellulomonas sp. ICMP 17802 TaxID=3239199 RepID=UPI00351AEDBC
MLDVRKLRMLTLLERLGTLAAVADELHLSAPGVSMQLSSLEKEVGIPLTQRQGRRVVLTPAGSVLAEHARDVVDRLSIAELELDALRAGTVGRYTVAAFPSAARTILAEAFRRLRGEDGSTLELHLTTAEPEPALDALAAGAVDLAVIHAYSNVPRDVAPDVATHVLGTDPVWLAVPALGDPSSRLEDYAEHPWIAPTGDVTCYAMVERACGLAGFRPRIVAESMDFAVQLALVAAGVGVALVPDLTVDRVPHGVRLLRPAAPVERTVAVAARRSRLADPGVRHLTEVIAAAAEATLTARRASEQA